jgi:hypothetical protein
MRRTSIQRDGDTRGPQAPVKSLRHLRYTTLGAWFHGLLDRLAGVTSQMAQAAAEPGYEKMVREHFYQLRRLVEMRSRTLLAAGRRLIIQ